jgi:DNA-binding response OmpR family regulator
MIAEVKPSDLSCCGVISQIKARRGPRILKVVMVVQGGALERARGLDLGADDVISFPFEPIEFAARIRAQFREREPALELDVKLVVSSAVILGSLAVVISNRHSRKDTLQLKAEVARLNGGLLQRTPSPFKPGPCIPDHKWYVGNSRIFERTI